MLPKHQQLVAHLHQRIERGEAISDQEILATLGEVNVMTNAEQVAFVVMGTIAPICAYREHLTPQLLPHVLHPLVALGVESAEQVIGWIRRHLHQSRPFDIGGEKPVAWIEKLTTQPELIQTLLDQAMRENDREVMDDSVERYSPHIRIPLDQVDFQYMWSEARLSRIPDAIFIFDLTVWDNEDNKRSGIARMAEIISTISNTLAEADTEHQVRLVLFNTEGYGDFQYSYGRMTSFIPNLDTESVQVLWLHNKKVVHVIAKDQVEPSIMKQHTLDLVAKVATRPSL